MGAATPRATIYYYGHGTLFRRRPRRTAADAYLAGTGWTRTQANPAVDEDCKRVSGQTAELLIRRSEEELKAAEDS